MPRMLIAIALLLSFAGCQTATGAGSDAAAVEVAEESGWRRLAAEEDESRIDGVEGAWSEALAQARSAGRRRQIDAEGALLDPESALPRPAPTPGSYMCRLVRFEPGNRRRAMTSFQPFFCHVGVDADQLSITKQTGSERPSGYLWEDGDRPGMIFLGSLALGGDESPRAYGEDPRRDMAGLLERIGPMRFRLVIPRPRNGATLDVFELVPAPAQPEQ